MTAGEPRRFAFGAHCLDNVFKVLADGDALIRHRLLGHLEDVREDVILGVVVDDFDAALLIIVQRAEDGLYVRHATPPS